MTNKFNERELHLLKEGLEEIRYNRNSKTNILFISENEYENIDIKIKSALEKIKYLG